MYVIFERYLRARKVCGSIGELAQIRCALRECIDGYRAQFRSRAGRLWAAQNLEIINGELLRDQLCDKQTSASDIWVSTEFAKARALLDQMHRMNTELPIGKLKNETMLTEQQLLSFAPESQELKSSREQKRLNIETSLVSRLPIGCEMSREDIAKRQNVLRTIEAVYKTHSAGFTGTCGIANADEIMESLHPDEVLIEYAIPFHPLHPAAQLTIVVITKDQLKRLDVPLQSIPGWKPATASMIGTIYVDGTEPKDASLHGNVVISAREAIQQQNDDEAQRALKSLHQILVQPILDSNVDLCARKCIIVPHGMLHSVPFAALLSGEGSYLIEKTPLTIAPSASIWLGLRQQSRPEVASLLAFADPDLSYTDLPPLPYAERELEHLSKSLASLDCKTYAHKEATKDLFLAQAAGKSILHLSAHGDFPEQNAIDFHQILLAEGSKQDGRLTAEEIRSMHLQAARLVVLSICDGGLYRIGPGDEPYGLIPAFLTAGAENVIATLWPVKDDMSYFLMIEFYKHLLNLGPAEALQHSCKTLIQDRAYIRDWAGFTLVGSGKSWI